MDNKQGRFVSGKDSFFYQALRKLYIFAQIFGSASFSYSSKIGVHLKPINIVLFVLTIVSYSVLTYINATTELRIDAKGDQNFLFYLGMRGYPIILPFLVWAPSFSLFWERKRVAKLMEDILAVDSEVSQVKFNFEKNFISIKTIVFSWNQCIKRKRM